MKAVIIYISLLILVGIFSCKPEELPPPEIGTPVFSVSGDLVDITAGEDDFYLFTDYEKDTLDVYSFIGRFAKTTDCEANCNEELLIKFRDAQQTTGAGTIDIDNALSVGNYSYKIMNPVVSNDIVTVNLVAEPEGTGPFTYLWEIELDSLITYATPQVTLTFENNTNLSSLDVCLSIMNNNSCPIQYCNAIFLNNNAPNCQANFDVFPSPALLLLEANMINGTPPFNYLWSTGSVSDTLTEVINGPLNGTYCVTITDNNGCSDEICKELFLNQGGSIDMICSSRFSYDKTIDPGTGDLLQLSTVFIQYTDSDGNIFRSDLQPQSNSSSFEIISVENYENNENGDKTKKLRISANCELFNANGMAINFPFEGVIAVAYP